MSVERYPYYKLIDFMYRSAIKLVNSISTIEDFVDPIKFREKLFELFLNEDIKLKEAFKDIKWITKTEVMKLEDGTEIKIPVLNEYMEQLFADTMDQFCENKQDLVEKFNSIITTRQDLVLPDFEMELFAKDEAYEAAKIKARKLLREYAEKKNVSILKAKMSIPDMHDPNDIVLWLESELSDESI